MRSLSRRSVVEAGPLKVCVVGSGVGGLSTAHHIIKVCIIEELLDYTGGLQN